MVLGMGCVILLWHSLCLPYNYFCSTPFVCTYFMYQSGDLLGKSCSLGKSYVPFVFSTFVILDIPFFGFVDRNLVLILVYK